MNQKSRTVIPHNNREIMPAKKTFPIMRYTMLVTSFLTQQGSSNPVNPLDPVSTITPSILSRCRIYPPRIFYPSARLPNDIAKDWIATCIITLIGAITRFVGLGTITDNGTPIFDEKHYVPQGYQVLTNGHWLEDNPGFGLVVHPPLGKQLIAVGEWLFGYTPFGWRFSAAFMGTISIFCIIRIARRLSRSTLVGAIAGVLAIVDGVLFLSSRTALLDIFLTTFLLAAISCLLVDRDQIHNRLKSWSYLLPESARYARRFGPRLGFRWWRITAAILLGCAASCKWSAIYFIVMLLALSLCSDALARKKYGIYRPWLGTLYKDSFFSAAVLLGLSGLTYLSTWCFWFGNETAYDRFIDVHHMNSYRSIKADHFIAGKHPILNHFLAIESWWYYQVDEVLHFHTTLTNQNLDKLHPWESKPWTWPMGLRPVLYYYEQGPKSTDNVAKILLVGTPTMWWLAFPVLAVCLWQSLVKRRWSYTVVLLCYSTAWLPWFSNIGRQMYYFYAVAMAPFLIIAIAMIIGDFIGATKKNPTMIWLTPQVRWIFAANYIAITILCFLWLLPIFTGKPISPESMDLRSWLPSW